jgi:hypothetical protein
MKKIFLVAPWLERGSEFCSTKYHFTSKGCVCQSDALLVWWAPSDLLFWYDGPKGFYCAEPFEIPSVWRQPRWLEVMERLEGGFVYRPGHAIPRNRVPHDTHHFGLKINMNSDRIRRAVAVVSNNRCGAGEQFFSMRLRNDFCVHPLVDLYGRRSSWDKFLRRFFSGRCAPRNYLGDFQGDWRSNQLIEMYSRYKAVVCMENSVETNYFTEKFVNAVRGGAVPIYHAHPSVREGILHGAAWVDPADYGFDPGRTVAAALDADLSDFQQVNAKWLHSDCVAATESSRVRDDLCDRILGVR